MPSGLHSPSIQEALLAGTDAIGKRRSNIERIVAIISAGAARSVRKGRLFHRAGPSMRETRPIQECHMLGGL